MGLLNKASSSISGALPGTSPDDALNESQDPIGNALSVGGIANPWLFAAQLGMKMGKGALGQMMQTPQAPQPRLMEQSPQIKFTL